VLPDTLDMLDGFFGGGGGGVAFFGGRGDGFFVPTGDDGLIGGVL